jgi:major membrane immunogen (membrane-anchored lipoprotein)
MQYALFALPIQAGKTDAARAFLQDLEGTRKSQYAASEQRLKISKEVWAIQQSPMGDLFVVFFQAEDVGAAVGQFVSSQESFDVWFKAQVQDTTGVDLNVPPSGPLSDVLSVYEA